ncbi:hypothetical protein [Clostridium paraputrificum]|uniref:hypothetical protein n=1 Tax=Clostridium paraputrificum TaxID=29363 RepID=UPI00189F1E12|nr:hypothetical protein [Clostridium paraputrificum]
MNKMKINCKLGTVDYFDKHLAMIPLSINGKIIEYLKLRMNSSNEWSVVSNKEWDRELLDL